MIEYVQPHNPDDRIIKKAVSILQDGGLVAYPTDSSWAIGCSSESNKGLDALARLKDSKKSKFTLLCSTISQISEVAVVNNETFKIIKKYTPGPVVFILEPRKNIEKKIGIKRAEVGVRIPDSQIPIRMVEELGSPLFTVTASKAMLDMEDMTDEYIWDNAYTEETLFECGWELEEIASVQLIIDSGEALEKSLSTVIRIEDGNAEIIRQGKIEV